MKFLLCGDVVGRSGRDAVKKHLANIKRDMDIDIAIVNSDNSAAGWGSSSSSVKDLFDYGADVLTGGDHVWDQKEAKQLLENEKRLLRPINYPTSNAGNGSIILDTTKGSVLIIHALGQVFIKDNVDDPFAAITNEIARHKQASLKAIIVDFHAEATSEKTAMGVYLDGKVSAVFGTHTHIPTADAKILRAGTGYITDVGMCGDYDNTIIGWDYKIPLAQFTEKSKQSERMKPSEGEGTFSALYLETDDSSGLAKDVRHIFVK